MKPFTPRQKEAFEEKIDLNGPHADPSTPVKGRCHLWRGMRSTQGRGLVCLHRLTYPAHRVAWVLARGGSLDDLAGLQIRNRCGVPHCVNPEHYVCDRFNPQSDEDKTASRDQEIIDLHDVTGITQMEIAEAVGVSQAAVSRVLSRRKTQC